MKTCTKCHKEKELTEFTKDSKQKDRLSRYCKKCNKEFAKLSRSKPLSKEKAKDRYLKLTYGITLEQLNQMVIGQNGLCSACHKPLGINPKLVHLDHDHKTGKIRKVLHNTCNQALGLLKEDESIVEGLLEYIKWCKRS